MATSSVQGGHDPFVMVHLKVLTPTPNPVTPELGSEGVVTVPDPPTNAHIPTPTDGVFAAKVADEEQVV